MQSRSVVPLSLDALPETLLAALLILLRAMLVPALLAALGAGCGSGDGPTPPAEARPPARLFHALVYDAARQRVLLVGGSNGGTMLGDTWGWTGAKWERLSAAGPSPRLEPLLAYDSQRQRVVLYGGVGPDFAVRNDMWEWDGSTWTRVAAGDGPRLQHAALGYDPDRRRLVLLGGTTDAQLRETWEWDGQQWTRRATTVPAARQLPTPMVYSSARHTLTTLVVDLQGGAEGERPAELWEWSGAAWSVVAGSGIAGAAPPGLFSTGGSDIVVLSIEPGAPASMSRWNGQQWTRLTGTLPLARTPSPAAYDAARQRAVVFGGQSAAGSPLDDTWLWDGTSWSQAH